jgi:REP element-mobilizing transposase RayT
MELHQHQYYHLYNRSNNEELLFKSPENYHYFLKKYREYLGEHFKTIAYCLMPTHFHFLVSVERENIKKVKQQFATFLSSYTKAINSYYHRHGSLFQPRTKAKLVEDDNYLLSLITYIHQNPIRSGLVARLEDWPYSSYPEIIKPSRVTFLDTKIYWQFFQSVDEFKVFSLEMLNTIKKEYWV